MKVLEGKVAVVTGGNAGIGLAIARAYLDEGARVFVAGRRQAQLDEVEAELGPGVTGIRCDVGRLEDLDALFATVAEQAGRIDVLVANAGSGSWRRWARSPRSSSTPCSPPTSRARVHRAEGLAAALGGGVDHPHRIDGGLAARAVSARVRGDQGCAS